MSKPILSLKNVNKYYGDLHVLKDLSLEIYEGEFLTLLGPSGCGKTTTLRAIAGLEDIESGDILLNGESIVDLPPNLRNVNTVFQDYALFPHLNVYENITYGPRTHKNKKIDENELKKQVEEVLELVQMEGYENRMPNQLSGGQMQRIAIARALINEPAILLLDEPLGALDLKLRKHMQVELSNLQRQTGTTFIYVTHDQDEALNMSDRIVVLNEGIIEQLGTPRDVYNNPNGLFVAEFVGDRNIKEVKILKKEEGKVLVKLGESEIYVKCSENVLCDIKEGDTGVLAIHSDKMKIVCEKAKNSIKAIVKSVHYAGSQIRTEALIGGEILHIVEYLNEDCNYGEGDTIYITWQDAGAVLLPNKEVI